VSLAAQVEELLGRPTTTSYDVLGLDLERSAWVEGGTACRDRLGLTFFDVLTAVDLEQDGFQVVLRLWAPVAREGLVLRTRCPREHAQVPSLTGVFAGAGWHERATAEMFGIAFEGHPAPDPLLLDAAFQGHPLRKDFPLAARGVKAWPGAKEPGESGIDLPVRRRRPSAPGVPPWSAP